MEVDHQVRLHAGFPDGVLLLVEPAGPRRLHTWKLDTADPWLVTCPTDLRNRRGNIDVGLHGYKTAESIWIRAAVAGQPAVVGPLASSLQLERRTGIWHRAERNLIVARPVWDERSDEHTSDLQSLMRISYAVFCLHNK